MNQQCKVCGEPAAGFHFGAFTCEGCKSFFGRSYNNLSSISECKNNGECIINKKNRTACKACRLRKCLLVGMSKSGSRYGRRSNWFKIHCLLQEQQQQAQQAAERHQNGHQKPPALSPNSLNLMRHPSYSSNIFSRPPCTKEELMMLRLDEYVKHPQTASSPSISSPDSHNSDSSIEIGDKRNSLLNKQKHAPNTQQSQPAQSQQSQHNSHRERSAELQASSGSHQQSSPLALNKDFFLPMPFGAFPGLGMMPPPGFLPPPTQFLFSSYHNALYEQNHHLLQQQVQQGLLKTSDLPLPFSAKSPSIGEKDDVRDCDEDVEVERHSPHRSSHLLHHQHPFLQSHHLHRENGGSSLKRGFSEVLLEQQRKQISLLTKLPKNHNNNHHHLTNNNNNNNNNSSSKDNNKSLPFHHHSSHHRHHTTSSSNKSEDEDEDIDINESDEVLTPPRSPKSPSSHRAATHENNPIDLSMKSGSSTKSDDINHNYYKIKTNNKSTSDSLGSLNGHSLDSNDSISNDHKTTSHVESKSTTKSLIHCHEAKEATTNNGSSSRKQLGYEKHHRAGVKNESDDSDDAYRHNIDVAASDDRSEEVEEYERELKRRKLHLAAPLDLTTKV